MVAHNTVGVLPAWVQLSPVANTQKKWPNWRLKNVLNVRVQVNQPLALQDTKSRIQKHISTKQKEQPFRLLFLLVNVSSVSALVCCHLIVVFALRTCHLAGWQCSVPFAERLHCTAALWHRLHWSVPVVWHCQGL